MSDIPLDHPADEPSRSLAGQNRIRLIGMGFGVAFLAIAASSAISR